MSCLAIGIAEPHPSDFIRDFGKLPFPTHLGKYFIKIGKIKAKIHEIGKIKAIFGLGMTPIYGLKNGQIKSLHPDMNNRVTAFTVREKSINTQKNVRSWGRLQPTIKPKSYCIAGNAHLNSDLMHILWTDLNIVSMQNLVNPKEQFIFLHTGIFLGLIWGQYRPLPN